MDLDKLLKIVDSHLSVFRGQSFGWEEEDKINYDMLTLHNEFGFVSDHGSSFVEKYCGGYIVPIRDLSAMKEILSGVDNISDVGGLYVSYWREVTHFLNSDPFDEKKRKTFILILTKLKELIKKKMR